MADAALNRAERAELERLRAQTAPGRGKRAARWAGSVALLVLAAIVLVLASVTVFARNEILNTDRFAATMAPLYKDEEVRAAIAVRVNGAVNKALDTEKLVAEAIDAVQTKGGPDVLDRLAVPLASGIDSFIDKQVTAVVYSDQFTELWREATLRAHTSLVALLNGDSGGALELKGQDLVLDLGPLVERVKNRMVEAGFGLAERIPAVSVNFTIAQSEAFPKLRVAASLLDAASWILPIAGLALLAAGIAVAPNRRRGLLIGALCLAVGMLLLSAGLTIGRGAFLAGLGDGVQSQQAAVNVYDTLTRFLKGAAETITVLAVIVALACWVTGPGRAPTALRRLGGGGRNAIARGLAGAGVTFGRFGTGVHRNRRAIEIALVVAGLLWLVLWRHPGVSGVVTVAIVVAVLVLIVELIGRAAVEAGSGTDAPAPYSV
ncbi:hypothetical protein [Glycomyces algeriensis]|uniref:Integral membrane protein n=1 Tax=Glycomyces algeriensis TaxID=256037 RepID=A0A9W6GBW4_9ACTN|nr:hypothetical protein [Glycomyces algeriensis]MDA1365539.1 hypothetical protein [Glycomyces algeriensis]MDR7351226.1 hypothetical protein [Glycomyces algeriensis]GLI43938.1 hypothetical protein GALLR39Z86_37880 [Glycomyces algeriensis]